MLTASFTAPRRVALYGTTQGGGAYNRECDNAGGCATVFSMTKSGKETVLYSFKGDSSSGRYPAVGLINVNRTLYGTTYNGGHVQRRNGVRDHYVRRENRTP